ncbi:MAG: LPS export ABC transporter periplasmic protein LptC [Cyanobacteria bacterium REEB65]|nr:LPS export ABC transporter periplasmic protein LptC [Cyanobacteria bacterium REEB65]
MATRARVRSALSSALARQAAWIVGILILVVAGSTLILRRKEIPKSSMLPSVALQMNPSLELKFTDVVMQGRESGIPHWTISAPTVEVGQSQRLVEFEGHPHGEFLNIKDWTDKPAAEQHNRTVTWSAEHAEFDNDYDQLTITGDDDFVTDEDDHMTTQSVTYRTRDHLVNVTQPVEVHSHDGKLAMRADQATADTQLEVLDLAGHVRIDSKVASSDAP